MIDRLRINAAARALINRLGCLDAAAETINASTGAITSKGVLSRRLSGHLDWTVIEVAALEDALGVYPVTRLLARRLKADQSSTSASLVAQSGAIAKETGEAINAILAADMSAGAKDQAQAIIEIDEAIEALQAARAVLEADA